MRFVAAFFMVASVLFTDTPNGAYADPPSGFATEAPTTPPDDRPPTEGGPATPVPTLENQPAINPEDYVRYLRAGTGSMNGKISVAYGEAKDSIPPSGLPVYLIPATPYTQWYVGLHFGEFKTIATRTPTTKHGGFNGLVERNAYRRVGYNGIPDFSKPVPFTAMDREAFHAVRTTRTTSDGHFAFTGLPPGSYLLMSHWPLKITSSTMQTQGQEGFFGGYSSTSTEQRTAKFMLMYFGITAPQKVGPGQAVHVSMSKYTTVLGGVYCGPYGCGRIVIDQWLTLDERTPS